MLDGLPQCMPEPALPGAPIQYALLGCATPVLGIDGKVCQAALPRDNCCPPSLCQIDECGLICNLINTLPRGPLWDRAKIEALQAVSADCGGSLTLPCHSIVSHSVYAGKKLYNLLMDALWPALRESSPYSAYDTLDDWLVRLGWQDCFDCACRSPDIAGLSPLEVIYTGEITPTPGPCDGTMTIGSPDAVCPPTLGDIRHCFTITYPDDLACAVKRATAIALHRLSMGVVKNVDSINFVIAELGARIVPGTVTEADIDCDLGADGTGTDMLPDCANNFKQKRASFTLEKTSEFLTRCFKDLCYPNVPPSHPPLPAYYDATVTIPGDPGPSVLRVYPGMLAAECIVRSLMPPGARISLIRGY